MPYQIKIFDKKGKLKKLIKPEEAVRRSGEKLLTQKSILTTKKRIKDYQDQKPIVRNKTMFYDKNCLFCGKEFYPRHSKSKYCSHECQKRFYFEKKQKSVNSQKPII